jgi:Ni,Fe-hydrogenase III large subunit
VNIIRACLHKLSHLSSSQSKAPSKISLKDWIYLATTEGHRGQIFQMIVVEKWEIIYFKAKDPSFVNRNLIDYAVLNNIIADFPICNKSLDLSYSWFDM